MKPVVCRKGKFFNLKELNRFPTDQDKKDYIDTCKNHVKQWKDDHKDENKELKKKLKELKKEDRKALKDKLK